MPKLLMLTLISLIYVCNRSTRHFLVYLSTQSITLILVLLIINLKPNQIAKKNAGMHCHLCLVFNIGAVNHKLLSLFIFSRIWCNFSTPMSQIRSYKTYLEMNNSEYRRAAIRPIWAPLPIRSARRTCPPTNTHFNHDRIWQILLMFSRRER